MHAQIIGGHRSNDTAEPIPETFPGITTTPMQEGTATNQPPLCRGRPSTSGSPTQAPSLRRGVQRRHPAGGTKKELNHSRRIIIIEDTCSTCRSKSPSLQVPPPRPSAPVVVCGRASSASAVGSSSSYRARKIAEAEHRRSAILASSTSAADDNCSPF